MRPSEPHTNTNSNSPKVANSPEDYKEVGQNELIARKLITNWLTPIFNPLEFQFKITKLARSIGIGPSLYLITLKHMYLLFFCLSCVGFMPYFVIEPWTFPLSFGSFVDQYTVYKNVSLVEGGAENFKCVDENVDYRFVSIHRI